MGVVLVCVWIVVGLASAERALGAPQSGESEKQDTEKQTSGEAGTAEAKGDAKTKTAQDSSTVDQEPMGTPHLRLKDIGRDFVQDQKQIWTSPRHLRFSDTEWLVPLAGISTGFFMTDSDRQPKPVSRAQHHQPLQHAFECRARSAGWRRRRNVAVELSLAQRTLA